MPPSRPVPILYVEAGATGGGSLVSLAQHLRSLDRERWAPVVVFLNESPFAERIRALGIPVHRVRDPLLSLDSPRLVRAAASRAVAAVGRVSEAASVPLMRRVHADVVRTLAALVRREGIRILHLNNQPDRDLYGFMAAERTGVACVSHLRSLHGEGFGPSKAAYCRRLGTVFVANSRATAVYWIARGLPGGRVRVVYNGLEPPDVHPVDLRSSFGLPGTVRHVVGCLANLQPAKGHDLLFRAFARVAGRHLGCRLLVIGDGPLRPSLEALAGDLGIGDSIVWAGYVERPLDLLAGCRAVVASSRREGFCRAAIEAMAVGIPFVATEVGGLPEVVVPGESGLLVPPDDEEALAGAIERLLEDEPLRARLVAGGRRAAAERFGIERYVEALDAIYRTLAPPESQATVSGAPARRTTGTSGSRRSSASRVARR